MDANLISACAHVQHGFPVRRHQSKLDLPKLVPCQSFGFFGECGQIVFAGAGEFERLHVFNI
jgi:hypothetical protein